MTDVTGTGASVVVGDARVIDGSGSAAFPADLLIEDGVITAVEPPRSLPRDRFPRRIDAGGLVVCPGFVDAHSHADNAPLLDDDDLTKISQGVTTEVTGNCGHSLAPIAAGAEAAFLDSARIFTFDYQGWHSVADLFSVMDRRGGVTNVCPLVGHGALRLAVMGPAARDATAGDVQAMGALLTEALEAGAFGMSTGLIYPPGVYSNTDELAALASYLPPDRVYATHMRDESSRVLDSIEEALAIGRTAGCRVQISHLKAAGKGNWGGNARALEVLDAARRSGVPVTQDVYPYDAASTMLSMCLPPWVHDGGHEAVLGRLRDPAALARIRAQLDDTEDTSWENILAGAGYDGVLVATTGSHRHEGMTLAEIARDWGIGPFDALVRVLVDEEAGGSMVVVFDMSERDVEAALRSPYTSIGSDGAPPGAGGRPHPRLHGTFPRVLGRYVRERGVLDLPGAIRAMTSLPAATFGVPRRGTVATGQVADLVCFDPATIDHHGDFLNPAVPPVGIAWVMQSGHVVMDHGRWNGTRRGSRLVPA